MMRGYRTPTRVLFALGVILMLLAGSTLPADAHDRPFSTAKLLASRWAPVRQNRGLSNGSAGMTNGQFSKEQIESFPCSRAGDPAKAVDMSCNTATLRQNYAPDNGIAIAVDPVNPQHLVAGSNYYLSHGTGDRLLPIERCSRRIVPRLEREDYEVRYREFDGPHTVPGSIAREALDWFTSG